MHDQRCAACRAKQLLPFFQRTGKVTGIVEFVLSGHRLKVRRRWQRHTAYSDSAPDSFRSCLQGCLHIQANKLL